MKLNVKIFFIALFIIFSSSLSACFGAILFADDFDGYSDSPTKHGWTMGSNVTEVSGPECRHGNCVKVNYTTTNETGPYEFHHAISTGEAYFRFYFKRTNHTSICGGDKFFKLSAILSSSNRANFTNQMNYQTGNIIQVDHGCGTGLLNDQSCGGKFGEGLWGANGTVVTSGSPYTFPDENWHYYEAYVKLNTNGNADGAYTIWIDGVKHREVTGVVMRNDANSAVFTDLLLGDYNDCRNGTMAPYQVYYDDIVISDKYNGPINIKIDLITYP